MKKLLLTCLLILPISVLAEDFVATGIVPEWKDFAPSNFVDIQEPKRLQKYNVVANYWYDRRVKFEEGLAECNSKEFADEQYNCYEALKVEQYKQNTDYNARIEARQQNANGIPEMRNHTDVMLPVNNYIDSLTRFQPNEFR